MAEHDGQGEAHLTRYCGNCCEYRDESCFPNTCSCSHGVLSCSDCWDSHLMNELDTFPPDELRCMEDNCMNNPTTEDMMEYASRSVLERYSNLCLLALLRRDTDFHYCSRVNCNSGLFQDTCREKFHCPECGHEHCTKCDSDWHEGQTCTEHENEIRRDENEEDTASADKIEATTKACPSCEARIEKKDGCEHMTCQRCYHEFCWVCLADYGPIDREEDNAHNEDCPLGLPRDNYSLCFPVSTVANHAHDLGTSDFEAIRALDSVFWSLRGAANLGKQRTHTSERC